MVLFCFLFFDTSVVGYSCLRGKGVLPLLPCCHSHVAFLYLQQQHTAAGRRDACLLCTSL